MTNLGSRGCLYLLTEISISHCEFSNFSADLRLSCLYHGSRAMSGWVMKLYHKIYFPHLFDRESLDLAAC